MMALVAQLAARGFGRAILLSSQSRGSLAALKALGQAVARRGLPKPLALNGVAIGSLTLGLAGLRVVPEAKCESRLPTSFKTRLDGSLATQKRKDAPFSWSRLAALIKAALVALVGRRSCRHGSRLPQH
jgi:hypothetical protein